MLIALQVGVGRGMKRDITIRLPSHQHPEEVIHGSKSRPEINPVTPLSLSFFFLRVEGTHKIKFEVRKQAKEVLLSLSDLCAKLSRESDSSALIPLKGAFQLQLKLT